MLIEYRISLQISLKIDTETMISESVRYQGIDLNCCMTYQHHIFFVSNKAVQKIAFLSQLMVNIEKPSASKCKIFNVSLTSISQSIFLHGSEIWTDALCQEKYSKNTCCNPNKMCLAYHQFSQNGVGSGCPGPSRGNSHTPFGQRKKAHLFGQGRRWHNNKARREATYHAALTGAVRRRDQRCYID